MKIVAARYTPEEAAALAAEQSVSDGGSQVTVECSSDLSERYCRAALELASLGNDDDTYWGEIDDQPWAVRVWGKSFFDGGCES